MILPARILAFALIVQVFAQAPKNNGKGGHLISPMRPPSTGTPSDSGNNTGVSPPPLPPATPAPTPPAAQCKLIKFRELDGQCTSEANPIFGQARLAQFSYVEGSSSAIPNGQNLKSAREISNIVFDQKSNTVNSRGLNELFTFFGAFFTHNFAASPEGEETLEIEVPPNDPNLDADKLEFRRSMRGPTGNGMSQRPINILPSAIDLVGVYGPNSFRNAELLELNTSGSLTGKLKTSGDNLMPLNINGFFNAPNPSAEFFLGGDHRSNEHPAILSMHTLFVREHNRLVDVVKARIPSLPPRELYEFARKINIARYQKVMYEEFYPAIIRRKLSRYRGFQPSVNPTASDIFIGAAFRIGHTLVGQELPRRGSTGPLSPLKMGDLFFRPASTFSSVEMDNILRGIANSNAQEVDTKVVDALRNFLFTNVEEDPGFDLIALNIQRGRDHALPKFNEIRELFGIRKARTFRGITRDTETARRLSTAYDRDVNSVEAFPGLLGEDRVRGSGMGRTMEALWRAEFTRLRDGDQFFYLRTSRLPLLLRRRFRDIQRALRKPSLDTFRDIIIRNTNITDDQLPRGNVFQI